MLLDGNDVILGPEKAKGAPPFASFYIVGDGVAASPGATSGGNDIIHIGDASSGRRRRRHRSGLSARTRPDALAPDAVAQLHRMTGVPA